MNVSVDEVGAWMISWGFGWVDAAGLLRPCLTLVVLSTQKRSLRPER